MRANDTSATMAWYISKSAARPAAAAEATLLEVQPEPEEVRPAAEVGAGNAEQNDFLELISGDLPATTVRKCDRFLSGQLAV